MHPELLTSQRIALLLFGCLAAALASCASAGPAIDEIAPAINATYDRSRTVLRPGDRLSVRFPEASNTWDHETLVRPDGTAAFVSIDDVQVAGLTVEELDGKLEEAYGRVLQRPDVTILPVLLADRHVVVFGEIHEPGELLLESDRMSLMEAIGLAGGPLLGRASMQNILLVRWDPVKSQRLIWKIDARPKQWAGPSEIWLQPDDLVFVPSRVIVNINDWVDRYIRRMIPFPNLFPTVYGT